MHYEISCLMEIFFSRLLVVYWMFRERFNPAFLNDNDTYLQPKEAYGYFVGRELLVLRWLVAGCLKLKLCVQRLCKLMNPASCKQETQSVSLNQSSFQHFIYKKETLDLEVLIFFNFGIGVQLSVYTFSF